jgi:hypothetical protein
MELSPIIQQRLDPTSTRRLGRYGVEQQPIDDLDALPRHPIVGESLVAAGPAEHAFVDIYAGHRRSKRVPPAIPHPRSAIRILGR